MGAATVLPIRSQPELSATQAASVPLVQPFVGVWEGPVTQPGSKPYEVAIALTEVEAGAVGGSIDYPGLGCGGSLSMISISETELVLEERIQRGIGSCVGLMRIELRRMDNESMRYEAWYPRGGMSAWATVRRVTSPAAEAPLGGQVAEEVLGTVADAALDKGIPVSLTFLVNALIEWANAQATAFGKFCGGAPETVAREVEQSVWKVSQGLEWSTPEEFERRVLNAALTDWVRSVPARFMPPFGTRVVDGVRELYMAYYDPQRSDDAYVDNGPFRRAFSQALLCTPIRRGTLGSVS